MFDNKRKCARSKRNLLESNVSSDQKVKAFQQGNVKEESQNLQEIELLLKISGCSTRFGLYAYTCMRARIWSKVLSMKSSNKRAIPIPSKIHHALKTGKVNL
jgi:hypothetical protein